MRARADRPRIERLLTAMGARLRCLVSAEQLEQALDEIQSSLYRFPAVDAESFVGRARSIIASLAE